MPLLMCPNDDASMQSIKRDGVEFDMCPTCRGVWLDRGELEKLIDSARSTYAAEAERTQSQPQQAPISRPQQQQSYQTEHGERGEYGERGQYGQHGQRRKRGFDLFDIFD